MAGAKLIECIPNFSEGRSDEVIQKIARSIAACKGVKLLDHCSDQDHNRSVFTFTGEPVAVAGAALEAAAVAIANIDLNAHRGVHPRIGAIDVVPFVPLSGIGMEDCAALARDFGAALWEIHRVPVFLYEYAAVTLRKPLEQVRRDARGGAEPDIGVGRHPTAGAAAVGARNFLIAWNIWLGTTDLQFANDLARSIRASSGGLPGVKALGLALPSAGCVQVSINSTDFRATPLHVVFAAVATMAAAAGVQVRGSELIGMIPAAALELSAGYDLRWMNLTPARIL